MENTLENKAKFFAQYWWQEVFLLNNNKYRITKSRFNAETLKQECYLELKPLSQISDEDAIKLGFTNARDFLAVADIYHIYHVDYLRSKGYALPYMDLSVEDLVEYGWVKLKEN